MREAREFREGVAEKETLILILKEMERQKRGALHARKRKWHE